MPIAEITAAITTVTNGLRLAKEFRDIEKSFDVAELKAKMADIYTALADAKIALADAREEIRSKQEEINSLLDSRGATVEYRGYTYKANSEGKPQGLPFCNACLSDGKQMRLSDVGNGRFHCGKCKSAFGDVTVFAWD